MSGPDVDDEDVDDGPAEKKPSSPWMRMASMGIELASFTLGLAGAGYFVDIRRGHETLYVTAFGALIGFGFGMFRFIQKANSGTTASR